ncbi:head-tail adaptor [Mycobacterium phage Quink]|uniref:Head-to-tail adaptor n=12 Tax=Viruses TaxID=10239 RepID=Q857Z7_9CAUD|nr:head-tail adaptor [Mycobacterium phage Cjw1]YP_002014334.1 head-tail adaptor [Mycobacterium phage Porky]YP_008051493.1 head-tail adaptor [Mycobacterium phage Murphy]YP_008051639.1 head-tail adaptor [Mycobacterium phage Dumbo]YP_008051950.1 head-tail adaptor [Mycobacterium phage Phrux]YP_008409408.1 head-tail adaptor [Mycobacterium phage DrDrey]YP_008531091.1 head-tail adaptor [Mycobacterium phage Quink]YP_008858742.1 head-tail adaptor [Mycobacterium phage HufflyPuff]YP_009011775.1 head-t
MTFAQQLADAFPEDADDAATALSWAKSQVEGYCGRKFDLVEDDVAIVDPYCGSSLLPSIPVVEISKVEGYLPTGNGMDWVELTNYWFKRDTGLIFDTTGLPGSEWSTGHTWPWLPGSLRVTYTHGYNPVPDELIDVAIRLAREYQSNPELLVSKQVGEIERRFGSVAGTSLSKADQAILDRYVIATLA